MLSPLDLFKSYLTLKSFVPWIFIAIATFGGFCFIKRTINPNTNLCAVSFF
ncbi:hypothetical protein [Candidatus Phytoplasma solani]|uniref:hypothetical protein n=1 Tax=Candidatus Phytoplasma solani TaxID=69896 RepID=UPI00358DEB31